MLTWIADFAPYGVITTDREFRIQSWNRWMELHSGKESAAVIGCNLLSLYPEVAQRGLAGRLQRALEGEVSVLSTALHGYLLKLAAPPGQEGFSQMQQTARIAPLQHQHEILGAIIIIEDVTQREFHALNSRRQHERDNILAWALAHLLESKEPRRAIRDLFCKIVSEFDFDSYLFYLRSPGGTALKLNSAGGVNPEEETRASHLDESTPLGKLFLTLKEPRAVQDLPAGTEPDAEPLYRQFGFHACALVPLSNGAEKLGALCFATRTRSALPPHELELIATIGQYLAVAVGKESINLQLHAAESQLRRHAQDLEHQVNDRTAKLREIIGELETFSHTVAHDLRAPIRALTGYCEALTEDYSAELPEEAKDIISRLNGACARLDLLTNDILEFSRVSRQEIHLGPVNLDALISDALFLQAAPPGAIKVRRPLLPVLAQRTLLQQCIANLIDNALKFIPVGMKPDIIIRTDPAPPGKVRIVVEDKGIGIAPEVQRKIFGIFERGTSSTSYSGSGIGLAIVDRALQRMGGACGVESEMGVGSRFWLELPASNEAASTAG